MMGERTEPDTIVTATLIPHPSAGAGPVRDLTVKLERQGNSLRLRYVVEGDVDAVKWPLEQSPGRADRLWEHTCFEVFVETADGYREFNLSPSGQWAAYAFTGYRQNMIEASETARFYGLDGAENRVALEAFIELAPSATRLALSAVIETVDGTKTWWALAHPSDRPDFHHPDSFVLDLP